MHLVKTTKVLLQELRDENWETFFGSIKLFCDEHDIVLPEFSDQYTMGTSRSCQQKDHITIEHQYRFDIFNVVIDFHLMELSRRFTEETMELLVLCSAFSPDENYKSFDIDILCRLAEKFYPEDFTEQEVCVLRSQLKHYKRDIVNDPDFGNMTTVAELCRRLVETARNKMGDEFLGDCMVVHAEREIAEKVKCEDIIDDFASLKDRKVQF
ncbi:uncharacterized protein LOC113353888 isoform X2 [Papaver somniferum]|uniref:uncharacterized protein LOC113353888 isoform X2 n=1 Tax=Papaver somniferum TaxID=3469 RepID=UPI000E6FBB96|nr:uncharacterized protein LOC113353888 isoform X2 [Papaver somniferum]